MVLVDGAVRTKGRTKSWEAIRKDLQVLNFVEDMSLNMGIRNSCSQTSIWGKGFIGGGVVPFVRLDTF